MKKKQYKFSINNYSIVRVPKICVVCNKPCYNFLPINAGDVIILGDKIQAAQRLSLEYNGDIHRLDVGCHNGCIKTLKKNLSIRKLVLNLFFFSLLLSPIIFFTYFLSSDFKTTTPVIIFIVCIIILAFSQYLFNRYYPPYFTFDIIGKNINFIFSSREYFEYFSKLNKMRK